MSWRTVVSRRLTPGLRAEDLRALARRVLWDNSVMTNRRSWILLGALAIFAALTGFWVARELDSSKTQLARGTWLPHPREIGPIALRDHTGKPFTEENLRGQPSLVFFGFTHCPDVCPSTLALLAQVKKAAAIPDLRVLLVSVDPARDTPEALSRYVSAFDPQFVGLTAGDDRGTAQLARAFGVAVARVDLPGGNYTMDHSATVFLLDDRGRIVAVFTPPFDTKLFAEDLKHVESRLHG
jgi:protein SCO1/2